MGIVAPFFRCVFFFFFHFSGGLVSGGGDFGRGWSAVGRQMGCSFSTPKKKPSSPDLGSLNRMVGLRGSLVLLALLVVALHLRNVLALLLLLLLLLHLLLLPHHDCLRFLLAALAGHVGAEQDSARQQFKRGLVHVIVSLVQTQRWREDDSWELLGAEIHVVFVLRVFRWGGCQSRAGGCLKWFQERA